MTDEFTLSVDHNGQEHHFNANFILQGYTHKFRVIVDETEIFFEPDEEGSYRAVMMPGQDEKALQKIDKVFLEAIQQSIANILA
jgi:hypothetical protein